ncbi:hypothetical protein [Streptomyces griseoaurantiacus]|uniref:hypothetical protein n=1 Tax=Streptomyces griseoaurantiacus TaxID=68213 RepID=UPI00367E57F5
MRFWWGVLAGSLGGGLTLQITGSGAWAAAVGASAAVIVWFRLVDALWGLLALLGEALGGGD